MRLRSMVVLGLGSVLCFFQVQSGRARLATGFPGIARDRLRDRGVGLLARALTPLIQFGDSAPPGAGSRARSSTAAPICTRSGVQETLLATQPRVPG